VHTEYLLAVAVCSKALASGVGTHGLGLGLEGPGLDLGLMRVDILTLTTSQLNASIHVFYSCYGRT